MEEMYSQFKLSTATHPKHPQETQKEHPASPGTSIGSSQSPLKKTIPITEEEDEEKEDASDSDEAPESVKLPSDYFEKTLPQLVSNDIQQAHAAYLGLYHYQKQLSPEQQTKFAQHLPIYFSRILLPRDELHREYLEQKHTDHLSQTRTLLQDIWQLQQYWQHTLPSVCKTFCKSIGEILLSKGYCVHEFWLSTVPKQSLEDIAQQINDDPILSCYCEDLTRRLTDTFTGTKGLGSGLLKTANTTQDSAFSIGASLFSLIPLAGGALSGATKAAYEVQSDVQKKRKAFRIGNWLITGGESDALAKNLALLLTQARSTQLQSGIVENKGKLKQLAQYWQKTKEGGQPISPEQDIGENKGKSLKITERLQKFKKEVQTISSEQNYASEDTQILVKLMSKHLPLEKASIEEQATKLADLWRQQVKLISDSNSEKIESTQSPILACAQLLTHAQPDPKGWLSQVEQKAITQVFSDIRTAYQIHWGSLLSNTQLEASYWLACYQDVSVGLSQPIQWSEKETHSVLNSLRQGLDKSLRSTKDQLEKSQKQKASKIQAHQKRITPYTEATQNIAKQLQKLGSTATPTTQKSAYQSLLETGSRDGNFSALERQYQADYQIWQTASRQNRPNTVGLHTNLVHNLHAAKIFLEHHQAQLSETGKQLEAEDTAIQKNYSDLKAALAFVSSKHSPPTISQIPPKAQSSIPSQSLALVAPPKVNWDLITATIHNVEKQLSRPPCAFRVFVWSQDLPGSYLGHWQWGFLLDSEKTEEEQKKLRDNPYWYLFHRILSVRLNCLYGLPRGLEWVTNPAPVQIFDNRDSYPYQHLGFELAENQYSPQQSSTLHISLPHFLPPMGVIEETDLPQSSPDFLDAQTSPVQDWIHNRLQILLYHCKDLSIAHHLHPLLPKPLLQQLSTGEKPILDPAYANDLQKAIDWLEQFYLAETTLSSFSKDLQYYEQFIFTPLEELHRYKLFTPLQTYLSNSDPLRGWFDNQLQKIRQNPIGLDENLMQTLITISIHRQWLNLSVQLQCLQAYSEVDQRITYLRQLERSIPNSDESRILLHQLRMTPNQSGVRLRSAEERLHWETVLLPKLWQTSNSQESTLQTQPLSGEVAALSPSAPGKALLTPQISIARRVLIDGTWQWQVITYPLSSDITRQLFDDQGNWLPKPNQHSHHHVYPIRIQNNIVFYLKVYPKQPASEWLVHGLDRRLGIWGTPMMELVKIHHGNQTSAALISTAIEGQTLQEILEKNPQELDRLSLASFIQTFLRILLTHSKDNDNNYFLIEQPDNSLILQHINNEQAFVTINREQGITDYLKNHMQMPWLDQKMDPSVEAVLNAFMALQPRALIADLLQDAQALHAGWNALFTEKELMAHFNRKQPDISLPIMYIPKDLATKLINRFISLQTVICFNLDKRFTQHPSLNGLSLSKAIQPDQKNLCVIQSITSDLLIQIRSGTIHSPQYELAQFDDWQKGRLDRLYQQLLEKDPLASAEFQNLPLEHRLQLWKKFKQALDKKRADGSAPLDESQQTFLLQTMAGTPWKNLDFSLFLPHLVTEKIILPILQGAGNQLRALNLNGCTALPETILTVVRQYCPQLKKLYVNQQTQWIELTLDDFPQLTLLECNGATQLQTLKLTPLPNLQHLSLCNNPKLTNLANQIRGLISNSFEPYVLPKLSELNLTGCQHLEYLHLFIEDPERLVRKYEKQPKSELIEGLYNAIFFTKRDFITPTQRRKLYTQLLKEIRQNQMERPEEEFLLLIGQMVSKKELQDLDLSWFTPELITEPALIKLLGKEIRSIDISGCTQLSENILKTIAYYCPKLERLYLNGQNQWTTLAIPNFSELEVLECNDASQLKQVTCGKLPKLKYVSLANAVPLKHEVVGIEDIFSLPALDKFNTLGSYEYKVDNKIRLAKSAEEHDYSLRLEFPEASSEIMHYITCYADNLPCNPILSNSSLFSKVKIVNLDSIRAKLQLIRSQRPLGNAANYESHLAESQVIGICFFFSKGIFEYDRITKFLSELESIIYKWRVESDDVVFVLLGLEDQPPASRKAEKHDLISQQAMQLIEAKNRKSTRNLYYFKCDRWLDGNVESVFSEIAKIALIKRLKKESRIKPIFKPGEDKKNRDNQAKHQKIQNALTQLSKPAELFKNIKLQDHPRISSISFNKENLGNQEAWIVSHIIELNLPTLSQISLANNAIDSQGAKRLLRALKKNPYLIELNLNNNPIDNPNILACIKFYLKRNRGQHYSPSSASKSSSHPTQTVSEKTPIPFPADSSFFALPKPHTQAGSDSTSHDPSDAYNGPEEKNGLQRD